MKKLDFHLHLSPDYPVEKSAANLRGLCERQGYDAICVQTITHLDGQYIKEANETTAAVRSLVPGAFAFGNVAHTVKSVRWMDNGEELSFMQKDGMLCANFTGQPYGNSFCVRVAVAEIEE